MLGSGNGNGGSAARRPPMGGGGAGWDEGASQFAAPQSVVPTVSAPTATYTAPQSAETRQGAGSVEEPAESDSFKSGLVDFGDYSPPPMRPPSPPVNHWSVRQSA